MRKGGVDGLAVAEAGLEFVIDDFLRAFFPADAAAGAILGLDVAGAFLDGDGEIADKAIHFLHLGIGQQGDVGVIARQNHFGGQDAGRAVESWEGLIELGHVATDGWFTFHQVDRETRIGNLEGGLDASNATADNERGRVDRDMQRFERFVVDDTRHTTRDDGLGLLGGGNFVSMHPRVLLPDGDQFAQVRVQTGALAGGAEGGFVQVWGAGSHDHTGQFLLFDILLDQFLAQAGAHELVVAGNNDTFVSQIISGPLADLGDVDHTGDIGAAVANINANAFLGFLLFGAHSLASSLAVVC